MKSMRYIVTRPCLQEGSLSILKYLQSTFPQSGPATFVDDKGEEHSVQVDTERARVWGLGGLYHAQHLGVNDVLVMTTLAPARYQVEAIVKPHAPPPLPRREQDRPPETRRVVVSSTAHVREVRMQEVAPAQQPAEAQPREAQPRPVQAPEPSVADSGAQDVRVTEVRGADRADRTERPQTEKPVERARAGWGAAATPSAPPAEPTTPSRASAEPAGAGSRSASGAALVASETAVRPASAPVVSDVVVGGAVMGGADAELAELAHLTGYRLDDLGGGVLRLRADLGAHGYAVLVALDEHARSAPAWKEETGYRVMLCSEGETPQGVARLTHEALAALIEHARLAPLSPVDLRGYWKAGHVDLESAASVAELVSAHLGQRGIFSFVLLTLAQQPAHSVVSVPRLAEKLGSGVNYAELGSILETLTRAPFLALTPLSGGQFLLRTDVADILADLAQYSEGVRRRIRTPAASGAARREGVRA
ncbi:hypothetical protein GCM10010840_22700 [Deinococcus aerolatus]|uniref:Uncharacterized protein n=1 Tax=Deinococcus aerolatus TaxID=522487 RepID=A0ABQ2GBM3_9DEIO|nr:hypothetical protein [Deinococcus aerolatus]GGL84370.1 hypothetical protein GCM10010840_22700 [Deinococcus aerolatus]